MLHVLLDAPPSGAEVVLTGPAGHHVGRVLRARPGEAITAADGSGGCYRGTVLAADRDRVVVAVSAAWREAPPPVRIHALLPVLSRDRMTWAVEKLVEVGIWSVTAVVTEHSATVATPDRLRAVARAAAEQSRRAYLPPVTGPVPLEEGLASAPAPVLAADTAGAQPLSVAIPPRRGDIAICTGPEGGFGPADRRTLGGAGAVAVTLGPTILRAETAPLVLVAVLLHHHAVLDSAPRSG